MTRHVNIGNKPNYDGPDTKTRINAARHGIEIGFAGYGSFDQPNGPIIYIEKYDGKLTIHIWPDIGKEEPLSICLDGAREKPQ